MTTPEIGGLILFVVLMAFLISAPLSVWRELWTIVRGGPSYFRFLLGWSVFVMALVVLIILVIVGNS